MQRQERVQLEQEVKRQLETLEAENARILEQCSRLQHDTEDKDKEVYITYQPLFCSLLFYFININIIS